MVAIPVDLIDWDLIAEGVGTVWPLVNTSSDPNTRERLGKDYRRLSEGVSMRAPGGREDQGNAWIEPARLPADRATK
jgi:hypothetical protein